MRIQAAAVGMAMILVACGHQAQSAPPTSKLAPAVEGTPNRVAAASVDPDPRVGAVFLSGSDLHACTGSVLHSAAGNLVLTAAHCLSAGGPVRFVPGFASKATPDDMWTVDAVYLDPRWLANKDPLADYVIARVGHPTGGSVEAVVGSALTLGAGPAGGSRGNGGGRRPCDRLSGQPRAERRRVSRAALRGPGRRHQRRALDQRLDRHRCDRWSARRRLRGEPVLLAAVRPAHRPAVGAGAGRRAGRRGAAILRRRVLTVEVA